jgi:hypothetical protein
MHHTVLSTSEYALKMMIIIKIFLEWKKLPVLKSPRYTQYTNTLTNHNTMEHGLDSPTCQIITVIIYTWRADGKRNRKKKSFSQHLNMKWKEKGNCRKLIRMSYSSF